MEIKKRPFYYIMSTVDYDGYDSWVDYIGDNKEAAVARYRWICDCLRDEYLSGYDEEDLVIEIEEPREGKDFCSAYMNNQDSVYINVLLSKAYKNEFCSVRKEKRYKESFPNAKF